MLVVFADCLLFVVQIWSTLIAVFGFSGYSYPRNYFNDPQFVQYSNGNAIKFFPNPIAPIGLTESVFGASVLGCL